ncbi:MAG: MinD/ParA family protein [Deltaproteobacteria bacterium]|nr:MinD/ParA family protein [Deltaproteobacteria bacterium]
MDQAAALQKPTSSVKVIAVASGKGGVGKTNTVINLACSMAALGDRVMVLDADLGLGNLDVMLGLAPEYNLQHLFAGEKKLTEIIIEGPRGIKIIPAASGIQEVTHSGTLEQNILMEQMSLFEGEIDFLFIDAAAGISDMVTSFVRAADAALVVATPEPTSMTDAYALMKVLCNRYGEKKFYLLLNQVSGEAEARRVYSHLSRVGEKFLDISLIFLGYIPKDANVPMAVCRQQAVVEYKPESPASRSFVEVARRLRSLPLRSKSGGLQYFWQRLAGGDNLGQG